MSGKWKDIVRKVAPALGTVLGGPLAGMAVKTIGDKLLGNPNATEDELEAAIAAASPADLIRLREIDKSFEKEMRALDIDVFRLEVEDRKSARDLYRTNYWPQVILSGVFIVGYLSTLWVVLAGKVNPNLTPEMLGMAQVILGVLTAAVPQILSFWFGSSFGSREKTAHLAASSPANGGPK